MSSKKSQPLRPLSNPPLTPRWKPSTPHGTRAQLHKSGGDRRKSAGRVEKPWSARDILRQLSRVETAKPLPIAGLYDEAVLEGTPYGKNDETPRTQIEEEDDDDTTEDIRAPRLSVALSPSVEDEEGEDIGPAPTPSILPDEDEDVEGNTQMILTKTGEEEDEEAGDQDDKDFTLKSIEYGRRTLPDWERRMSRPSFGSIRMSDFRGAADEDSGIGKAMDVGNGTIFGDDTGLGIGDDEDEVVAERGDDPEESRLLRLRQSMSMPDQHDDTVHTIGIDDQDEDTFRLHFKPADRRSMPPPPTIANDKATPVPLSAAKAVSPLFFSEGPRSPSPASESENEEAPVSPSSVPGSPNAADLPTKPAPRKKPYKVSKHGIKVPSLPSSLIKRLGMDALASLGRRKSRIGRDSFKALEQATEWFFEQAGEDLDAYSQHAGRKRRVAEEDVLALMKRQRNISAMDKVQTLAKEHIPKDVLRELDLP